MNATADCRGFIRVFVGLVVLVSPFLLSACTGNSIQELSAYVDDVKSRTPEAPPAPPEFSVPEIAKYHNNGRDPFQPLKVADVSPPPPPDPPINRTFKEELEHYPLDALRMVGTLNRGDQLWGLVRAPDGVIHRVATGNYMGENYGKVNLVSEARIELTETVLGPQGWHDSFAALDLTE